MPENEPTSGCSIHGPNCTDDCANISNPEETTEDDREQLENERIKQKMLEVKEIVERKETRPNVKELLQNVEIMAVITDLKPLLDRKPIVTERLFTVWEQTAHRKDIDQYRNNIFSEEDIEQLEQILSSLGVVVDRTKIHEKFMGGTFPGELFNPCEFFRFYNKDEILETMKKDRENFKRDQILAAIRDINKFINDSDEHLLYHLEGIPSCDVEDFNKLSSFDNKYEIDTRVELFSMRFRKLIREAKDSEDPEVAELENFRTKNKISDEDWEFILEKLNAASRIDINGPVQEEGKSKYGSLGWRTFNPESQEVQDRKKQLENMVKLQEEVFGYED